jgi:hypothetical protein
VDQQSVGQWKQNYGVGIEIQRLDEVFEDQIFEAHIQPMLKSEQSTDSMNK